SPLTAAQVYDSFHYFALAAALAGGTGGPGEFEQNAKVADRLRRMIYRGVMGTTKFSVPYQSAISYPSQTKDPSLGMPHQFLQHQDHTQEAELISPAPYISASFVMPPWMK